MRLAASASYLHYELRQVAWALGILVSLLLKEEGRQLFSSYIVVGGRGFSVVLVA